MNEADKSKVEKLGGNRMNAAVGAPILIEPAGMGKRFKTTFIGMERGSYIIVRVPRIAGMTEYLYVEKPVTVRYFDEGQLLGFKSEIIYMAMAPFRLAFLKFPKVIEALNLRKNRRIGCFFPARLIIEQDKEGTATSFPAMIIDISSGGCQAVVESDDASLLPRVSTEQEVALEFKMFGSDKQEHVQGRVKNMNVADNRQTLGVKFDEVSEDIRARIKEYIENITGHLRV